MDGNKEMVAMGCMNIVGSFTSCYTATGETFKIINLISLIKFWLYGVVFVLQTLILALWGNFYN